MIAADHPQSVEESCKCVFEKWLCSQNDASWNQLIEAINTIELKNLASKLEKQLIGKVYVHRYVNIICRVIGSIRSS